MIISSLKDASRLQRRIQFCLSAASAQSRRPSTVNCAAACRNKVEPGFAPANSHMQNRIKDVLHRKMSNTAASFATLI
jgi:hypothetical protein